VPGLAAAHAAKSGRGTAGFPPVSTIQKEPASPFPVPLRPTNNKTAFSKRYRRVVIQIWLRRTWIGKKKSSATVKPVDPIYSWIITKRLKWTLLGVPNSTGNDNYNIVIMLRKVSAKTR
jgi:hypothetical protein